MLFQRLKIFLFVAGAGKSVFWYVKCMIFPYQEFIVLDSSTIIEDVEAMRKAGLASLAFFYCDFREDQKKELRGLLSSLLAQLGRQSDSYCDVLSEFYLEHDKGLRHPSDDALVGCLTNLLKLPGLAPVYLIVDGLDECSNTSAFPSPRAKVLDLLEELIKSKIPNLRICVTSRPETDIKDVLDPLIFRFLSLHDQREQKGDIENYIKSAINTHPKNKRWKAEHKQLVIDVLTKKADGM
jgi:NACHT domain